MGSRGKRALQPPQQGLCRWHANLPRPMWNRKGRQYTDFRLGRALDDELFHMDQRFLQGVGDLTWYAHEGPGGATQWKTDAKAGIIRLTTDMALLEDPQYASIVNTFANDINAFNTAFDDAWFKLTTTNVGGEWSTEAKCTDGSSPISMRSDAGPEFVV